MMSHTSTPFKVLENPGDENDSSVMRSTFKGQRATDFPMKGLSSFSSVSKAGGLSGITKSTRKPLLDLSKGQLNSRLSTTTTKTHSHHHGVVINPMAMGDVPIKSKSRSVTTQHPFKKPNTEHNIEDMICSGARVREDPYDLVMRKADAVKVTIVPNSVGSENAPVDHLTDIKRYTDNIKFEVPEHNFGNASYGDDSFPDYPDFLF